jgi:hypothetical protein
LVSDAADATGLACTSAFFNSLRFLIRFAAFCFRIRLYLDLSPFTLDMLRSCHSGRLVNIVKTHILRTEQTNPLTDTGCPTGKTPPDLSIAKA